MTIRFARQEDLEQINGLRQQVHEIHAAGKPEIFQPGFSQALRDHLYTIWQDPDQNIVAAEEDGRICGYAVLNHIQKPANPYRKELDFLDVDEFGVDAAFRRQGAATRMIRFIREYAAAQGFQRVELNVWEFNQDALRFYEAAGFRCYRRYLELPLESAEESAAVSWGGGDENSP